MTPAQRLERLEQLLNEIDALKSCLEVVGQHAEEFQIENAKVRVISLEDLIQVKEHVRRPKDLEVAAELRAIRDRLRSK